MGDHECAGLRCAQAVEAFGHDAQRIHIEARIGLVENAQRGLQHGHLEDFVTLLLTAREALVHAAVGQFAVELHNLTLLAHQFQKVGGRHGFQPVILALGVEGGAHEVDHADTGNLHGLLE